MNHWVSIGIAVMWSTRDVEEALDLAGVEVHGQDPVDADASRHLATIRAEIGSRGADFLSWRA